MPDHIRRIKSNIMKLIAELGLVPPNKVDEEGGLDLAPGKGVAIQHSSSEQIETAQPKPLGDGIVNQKRLEPKT
jgi:hypothetical protein